MTATVDVNILLYASHQESPFHLRARQFMQHIASGPAIVHLFWPVLIGYLRIATHPTVFDRPLSLSQAIAGIDDLVGRPHIRVTGESDGFWEVYRRVSVGVAARGNLVPDAHLVGLMLQNGVDTIWSHDRDFRKFSGLTVKDPFEQRYAAGFD